MCLRTLGNSKKVLRPGENMLTLQGCIFMSGSPESAANGPDTVRGDHLQGQREGNTLVYWDVINMYEFATTVRGKMTLDFNFKCQTVSFWERIAC